MLSDSYQRTVDSTTLWKGAINKFQNKFTMRKFFFVKWLEMNARQRAWFNLDYRGNAAGCLCSQCDRLHHDGTSNPQVNLNPAVCIKPDGCGPVMTVTLIEVVSRFLNLYSKSLCIIQVSRDSGNTYPVLIRKSSSFVIGLLNSSWFVNRTMQLLSPLYLPQLRTYAVPTR